MPPGHWRPRTAPVVAAGDEQAASDQGDEQERGGAESRGHEPPSKTNSDARSRKQRGALDYTLTSKACRRRSALYTMAEPPAQSRSRVVRRSSHRGPVPLLPFVARRCPCGRPRRLCRHRGHLRDPAAHSRRSGRDDAGRRSRPRREGGVAPAAGAQRPAAGPVRDYLGDVLRGRPRHLVRLSAARRRHRRRAPAGHGHPGLRGRRRGDARRRAARDHLAALRAHRRRSGSPGFMVTTTMLVATPEFLLATVLVFVFAVSFRLLPVAGFGGPRVDHPARACARDPACRHPGAGRSRKRARRA